MDNKLNLLLPTPPRSPQPSIKQENILDNSYYNNSIDDDDENMLEDFINLLNEDNFNDLFVDQQQNNTNSNNSNNSRKRKKFNLDEQTMFYDFDSHFADMATTSSSLIDMTTPNKSPSELIDHLLSFEQISNSYYSNNSFDLSPPPTNPPSPMKIAEEESDSNFLKDFDNFDTFEKLASKPGKTAKRMKFDSESSDYFNDETMLWNNPSISPLFHNFNEFFENDNNDEFMDYCSDNKEEKDEFIKNAIINDHSYANLNEGVVKQEVVSDDEENQELEELEEKEIKQENIFNFDKITKKTKILVPLKHLMETLQQKSFLVSPLGPGKKVIRLTGNDSVKGVLQSSSALLSVNSSKPASQHNVRKRPHNPIMNRYTAPKLLIEDSSNQATTSSVAMTTSTTPPPSSSKKKTKAHNNMERMRRIDLRNSFDNLKKLVPILSKSPKCSKVEILRKAEEYIRGLRIVEKKLIKEEQQLKIKLQQLKLKIENN